MSLRRRLVVGMLLLLVAGLIATDVVTSSSTAVVPASAGSTSRSTPRQDQAYKYIAQVYQRDLKAGDRTPVTDPGKWLAELANRTPVTGHFTGRVAPRPRVSTEPCWPPGSAPTPMSRCSRHQGKVVVRVPSGLAGKPRPRPRAARGAPVQHLPDPHVFGTNHGAVRAREHVDRRARRRARGHRSTGWARWRCRGARWSPPSRSTPPTRRWHR